MSVQQATNVVPVKDESFIQKIKDGVKTAVVRGEFEVPVLPNVTAEIMKLLNDPNVGMNKLEQVIKQDPAMSARLIKTANSVMYRGAMEISSLQNAMARIGLKNVKDIAITMGIQSKAFNIANFEDVLSQIWKNSLSCAIVSQQLAKSLLGDRESAFLAGLLSNIGKPVLVQICGKLEAKEKIDAQKAAQTSKQPFDPKTWRVPYLREEILPVAMEELHATVGAAVGARWGLPEPIHNSIKFLRNPMQAPEQNRKLALTIALAHRICSHFGFGTDLKNIDFSNDDGVKNLELESAEFNEMLEDIPDVVSTQLSAFST
jgi:HD-like signal output (HDOD) protein